MSLRTVALRDAEVVTLDEGLATRPARWWPRSRRRSRAAPRAGARRAPRDTSRASVTSPNDVPTLHGRQRPRWAGGGGQCRRRFRHRGTAGGPYAGTTTSTPVHFPGRGRPRPPERPPCGSAGRSRGSPGEPRAGRRHPPTDDRPGPSPAPAGRPHRPGRAEPPGTGARRRALSLLSRAAAALRRSAIDPRGPRRDTRRARGAVALSPRRAGARRAPARPGARPRPSAGTAHRRRRLLLRPWCALATGDGAAARTLRARAGETGSEVVRNPATELVAVALDVALARRRRRPRPARPVGAPARRSCATPSISTSCCRSGARAGRGPARRAGLGVAPPRGGRRPAEASGRRRCGARRGTGTGCVRDRHGAARPRRGSRRRPRRRRAHEPPGRRPRPRRRGVVARARRGGRPRRGHRRGDGAAGRGPRLGRVPPRRRGGAAHHRPARRSRPSWPARAT